MEQITIFLASPCDAKDERDLAYKLLLSLNQQQRYQTRYKFRPVRWEEITIYACEDPQEATLKRGADLKDCDLVIGIFKHRLGSPLRDSFQTGLSSADGRGQKRSGQLRTGTEWEIDTALALRDSGTSKPKVMVYECEDEPNMEGLSRDKKEELRTQAGLLDHYLQDLEVTRRTIVSYSDCFNLFCKLSSRLDNWIYEHFDQNSEKRQTSADPSSNSVPEFKGGNPYPGLAPYTEHYAKVFFGRDSDIRALQTRIADNETRFHCVTGKSGSGKSSLVRASLTSDQLSALDWFSITMLPAEAPLTELAKRIYPGVSEQELNDQVKELQQSPLDCFKKAVNALLEPGGKNNVSDEQSDSDTSEYKRLLLFVDQFEEVFSADDQAQAKQFLSLLAESVQSDLPVLWLTTMRSDFLEACTNHSSLSEIINDNLFYYVHPLSRKDLTDIINKPAECVSDPNGVRYSVEDKLSVYLSEQTMVDHEGFQYLPLLNYTLSSLFEFAWAKGETVLSVRQLEEITGAPLDSPEGGINAVLKLSAERAYNSLSDEAKSAHEVIFASLAEPPRGGASLWTRRRADKAKLLDAHPNAGEFLDVFSGAKASPGNEIVPLLRTSDARNPDSTSDQQNTGTQQNATVEVWHELLFECWPLLKNWLSQQKAELSERVVANFQATRWADDNYRASSFDWSGQRIERLRAVIQKFQLPLESGSHLEQFLYPAERFNAALDNADTPASERAIIGDILGELGERQQLGLGLRDDGLPDIRWVRVEGAKVKLDEKYFNPLIRDWVESPETVIKANVSAFSMSAFPVTEHQYAVFREHDNYSDSQWWEGITANSTEMKPHSQSPQPRKGDHPVIYISYQEAMAYCRWLSSQLGYSDINAIRLPTEHQWQLAAGGADADGGFLRNYPWGDEWGDENNPVCANTQESKIGRSCAAGLFPLGATPQADNDTDVIHDLAGNVWEWCLNSPDGEQQGTEDLASNSSALRALRGGSFNDPRDLARVSFRLANLAVGQDDNVGFRVVCESPIVLPSDTDRRAAAKKIF